MVKIRFLGVGEACDERHPNTSVLLEVEGIKSNKQTILLDCGFSVPFQFWKYISDPDELDILWISHFHGDHFLGVPLLLLRFWEMNRKKPLTIIGQKGISTTIQKAVDIAYPLFMNRFKFDIIFWEVDEGETIKDELEWNFGITEHGQKNLSVAIRTPTAKIFYSGDGKPTEATKEIARDSDLLIHEAFHIEPSVPGHGTLQGVLEMAEYVKAKSVACVHIQRDVRRLQGEKIKKLLADQAAKLHAFLPQSGDVVEIGKN